MVDFTVAIPTYNGAKRLPKILERLRSQTHTEHISWEVIVVDNNSTDKTVEVVKAYQVDWPDTPLLRYYFEAEQGAAYARQRAIKEAKGELVGCIDDDSLPAPDWVAAAYSFGQEHPQAGAYGGQIHGDFEVKPPEHFQKIQGVLALRERGSKPNLYDPNKLDLPPAAAVVIRKKTWDETVPERPTLSGPTLGGGHGSRMQGEDYEPLLHIHKAGWEIWYNPAMHAYHQIPKKRLERNYLISLSWGCGLCNCHLRMINAKGWSQPLLIARILFGSDFRVLVQHFFKYRNQLKTDLIAACKMTIFFANWVSPFYFLKSSIQAKLLSFKQKN